MTLENKKTVLALRKLQRLLVKNTPAPATQQVITDWKQLVNEKPSYLK